MATELIGLQNNVGCCCEAGPLRYLDVVIYKVTLRELHHDQPTDYLIDCVRQDRLGVASGGRRIKRLAHESVTLTSRGEVQLSPRLRLQERRRSLFERFPITRRRTPVDDCT